MKILYLYAEVMGYTMATIRELAESGHEIHLVHWAHKKQTPYIIQTPPEVFTYNRSEFTAKQLKCLVEKIKPSLAVVSGWMDKDYLRVSRGLRRKGKPVVVGFDSHWRGSFRQWFAVILGQTGFLSLFFSHAWVPGAPQYEFARKIGFAKSNIAFDLYCADRRLFNKAYVGSLSHKKYQYPHRFLFVGRLDSIKGLDVLERAWQLLGDRKADWTLHLIGSGALRTQLQTSTGIVVKDFLQPEQLINEVVEAGCFLLPSKEEPWGVVVHEFAVAGLPLIVSDVVGAASSFLIPGFNGFCFQANNEEDLASKMSLIINMSNQEIYAMAVRSYELSQRITPKTSAANLLSVVS